MGTVLKRGRKSAAELATRVVPLSAQTRLSAPYDLWRDEEVEVWTGIVNSMPASHFGPETVPLLIQYCRHVVNARRLAQLIRQEETGKGRIDLAAYGQLLAFHERESRAINALSRSMRLSQISRATHKGSRPFEHGAKPWET